MIEKEKKKIRTKEKNVIEDFKKDTNEEQKILENYEIESEKIKIDVTIKKTGTKITYFLNFPEIKIATRALLENVRNELLSSLNISIKEMLNQSSLEFLKKKFLDEAMRILGEKVPTMKKETLEFLSLNLLHTMLGLGNLEFLINDKNLEEIVIHASKEQIRVFHKKYGWLETNIIIESEEEIANYSNIIARRAGRQINLLNPLLDAHLTSGDRVNSILYPISTKGNTITIRKFARDPYTMIDLIKNKTIDIEIATILWLGIEYEMNIIFSGGTASGKTSILNACMPFIPPNHRIISVEDTRELMLPDFLYWTPLVTRLPNAEGKGGIDMLSLLINSLRMRPDRIVLGEIRRKEEAMVLFEAMHTGHSVYATLHANNAAETISRLTNPPISLPINQLKAVNLNIVMFRDRRKEIRRVLQVAEFDVSENDATPNILYRWIPEEDKMVKHSEDSKFIENISKNIGMTLSEMEKNLKEKRMILEWLVENDIRDLKSFGKVMKIYYIDRKRLINAILKTKKEK